MIRIIAAIASLFTAIIVGGCQPKEPIDSAATQPVTQVQAATTEYVAVPTRILDREAAARLQSNSGLTLQWIDWDQRGTLQSGNRDGEIWLSGVQYAAEGQDGALFLEGRVTEIGSDYFIFSGEISIVGTPMKDRVCKLTRDDWRFAITQGRKYWRLRQFEWCDGLTDYVDIYF